MFGNKASGLTFVYEFGCGREPLEGLDTAIQEMKGRNRLWNALVEIEHKFRQQRDPWVRTSFDTAIEEIDSTVGELYETIRAHKADAAYQTLELARMRDECNATLKLVRDILAKKVSELPKPSKAKKPKQVSLLLFSNFVGVSDLRNTITTLQQEKEALLKLAKAERKLLFAQHKEEIAALEKERSAAVKKARQDSGLYWGNYNDVVASYETARKAALKTFSDLRFHAFHGEGKLTTQFVVPLTTDNIFEPNGQFSFTPVDAAAWDPTLGRARKKMQWTTLRMRIRTGEDKEPIWFSIPVCLHRPFPKGARIQTASLTRRRIGLKWQYSVVVTLRTEAPEVREGNATAVVEFGCRAHEDGSLEVARIIPDKGEPEVVTIPAYTVGVWGKPTDIRAKCDLYRDAAKKAVIAVREKAPDWYREATEHAHAWMAPKHFLRLHRELAEKRFDRDEAVFAALNQFRERFTHLYPWECNLRNKLIRRRRELYRIVAAQLVQRYDVLLLGRTPPKPRKKKQEGNQKDTNITKQRSIAAAFTFKTIIISAARQKSVRVEDLDASGKETPEMAVALEAA